MAERHRGVDVWPIAWALVGVGMLFAFAVLRLGRRGLHTIQQGLAPWQWLVLAASTVLLVYVEGAGALARRWVPRVIGRAAALRHEQRPTFRLLAPLYVMSLIAAPRADWLRAWATTTAIVVAVLLVRTFPEPWRGITDVAVACGLLWGLGAILAQAPRAFR